MNDKQRTMLTLLFLILTIGAGCTPANAGPTVPSATPPPTKTPMPRAVLANPASVHCTEKGHRLETMRFEYFSFVTITTLGYGDITPLTNRASALALIEALIGQIYLVVLVAWLVGMYVSRKSK